MFGGYGLHWFSAADASVFASFTGQLAQHRAALIDLVEYPDELIVCQAAASEADRNAIQATLLDELEGRFTQLGQGGTSGAVTLGLKATEEDLAAQLADRYGAALDISVGALAYPLAEAEPVCDPTLQPSLIDGLDVSLVNPTEPARPAPLGTIAATLRLSNTGDEPIGFSSGQPMTTITDAAATPRTKDTRAVPLGLTAIALDPGAHHDFAVEISVASCDPSVGYVVHAGDHFVVASIYNGDLGANMHSPPLPITIRD